jgi:hypothetical protein
VTLEDRSNCPLTIVVTKNYLNKRNDIYLTVVVQPMDYRRGINEGKLSLQGRSPLQPMKKNLISRPTNSFDEYKEGHLDLYSQ